MLSLCSGFEWTVSLGPGNPKAAISSSFKDAGLVIEGEGREFPEHVQLL